MKCRRNVTPIITRSVVIVFVLCASLAFVVGHVSGQTPPPPKVEIKTYPSGTTRSQETTRYAADGKTKTETVKTKYDEDGRPTSEIQIKYKDGLEDAKIEKTWVYDGQGRLLFFLEESEGKIEGAGLLVNRYRRRVKYANADDKKGTSEEEVYSSATGRWRPLDTDVGDQAPSLDPLQPAKAPTKETSKQEAPKQETPRKEDDRVDEIMRRPKSTDSQGIPASQDYPKVELFGGYSYLRDDGEAENINLNGWNTSLAVNFNENVAVRGDFSGHYRSENGTDISKHQFLFGPQLSIRPNERVRIFLRPLFGVARFNAETRFSPEAPAFEFSDSAFAMALGGGFDVRLSRLVSIRPVQLDYNPSHFGDSWQHSFRLSTGLLFTFGRR